MAQNETNLILGIKKYLAIYDESTWGVKPVSPTYFHVPVNAYTVKQETIYRQSVPFVGTRSSMHSQPTSGMPKGSMSLPLYGVRLPSMSKSIAQYFLEWLLQDWNSTTLVSKGVEWAEGPDIANKRHNGLRINSGTLSGSTASGNLMVSLDLIGQSEDGVADGTNIFPTAQTLPTNRYKLIEFEYCGTGARADTTFYLGPNGNEEIHPSAFSLTVNNNLTPENLNSFGPAIMPAGQRVVTLQVTFPKQNDVFDAYNRLPTATELVGQIILKGLHGGFNGATGGTNWSQVVLDIPRISVIKPTDQGDKGVGFTQMDSVVLKPMTSANDITQTWTQEA